MSVRVRDRGPRRRCSSNRTLVRTIPALQQEPPPVPLQASTKRHYQWSQVSDYHGLATGSWSTGTTGTGTFTNQNIVFHHFTVANQRTDSYSAILPPIRFTPHAPTSDGGIYEGWSSFGGAKRITSLDVDIEVCRPFLPSDSHGEFPAGYTQLSFTDPFRPSPIPSSGVTSAGVPNLDSIAATTFFCPFEISVHAVQFRVNGSAVGPIQYGRQASRDYRVPIAKGDVIEFDVWYRISYSANASAQNRAGKGYIFLPTSFVASTATSVVLVRWSNFNSVPLFDYQTQTYEITISGHIGWTLKGGSNGPHKMQTADGWFRRTYTSTDFGSGFIWQLGSSTTRVYVRTDSEIPAILLQPGQLLDPVGFGPQPGEFYHYRPTFGGSTSYRKTSVNKVVYTASGGTATAAATVRSHASGVWDQAGTTVFDLIPYPTETTLIKGRSTSLAPVPLDWVPTSVTLTRVPL